MLVSILVCKMLYFCIHILEDTTRLRRHEVLCHVKILEFSCMGFIINNYFFIKKKRKRETQSLVSLSPKLVFSLPPRSNPYLLLCTPELGRSGHSSDRREVLDAARILAIHFLPRTSDERSSNSANDHSSSDGSRSTSPPIWPFRSTTELLQLRPTSSSPRLARSTPIHE